MSLWLMLLLSIGPYCISWRLWFRERIAKYRGQDCNSAPYTSDPHHSKAIVGEINWEDFWEAIGAATLWSLFWPFVLPVVILYIAVEGIESMHIETVTWLLGGTSRRERKQARLERAK